MNALVCSWIWSVAPATYVLLASCIVAIDEPRVNGIADELAAAGVADMGLLARDAGAGWLPGAPIPVEAGTDMRPGFGRLWCGSAVVAPVPAFPGEAYSPVSSVSRIRSAAVIPRSLSSRGLAAVAWAWASTKPM